MYQPYTLTQASKGKRSLAFFINFMLLGATLLIPTQYIENETLKFLVGYSFFAFWPLVFSVFPESPGMRLLGMEVRDEEKNEISKKKRFTRNSIYILYFISMLFLNELPPELAKWTMGPLYLFFMIFVAANAMTLLVNPNGLSLIDMQTGTRVFALPRPAKPLKAYK